MVFNVSNNDGIYCFVEQISVTKDRQYYLKLTKNIDVAVNNQYGFNSGEKPIQTVK